MDRRAFLAAGGAAAVAGLTGSAARAAVREPLFAWTRPGELARTPLLALYDDHTAYADARASLPLRPRQAESLRAHAAAVLRTLQRPRPDAPEDRLRVRDDDGTWLTAELDGDARHELVEHAQKLRRLVLSGEPWRPNAVLLAAVRLDVAPGDAAPWPAGIPLPAGRELRLRGERAQAVREELETGSRTYRVAPTHHVVAAWRHLLPHE